MKYILSFFIVALPLLGHAQIKPLTLDQRPLADRSSLSGFEIQQYETQLENSLTFSLQDKIVRQSAPFFIGNMGTLKKAITQMDGESPQLSMRMNTFEGEPAVSLNLNSLDSLEGRQFLRGSLDGIPGSKVKLTLHENTMTGRITIPGSQQVIVIQSIDDISALYEIDVSDISYD